MGWLGARVAGLAAVLAAARPSASSSVVADARPAGGHGALDGLLPPDGAALLAEALAAPTTSGLSAAEARLLGRVNSALDGAGRGTRDGFWSAVREDEAPHRRRTAAPRTAAAPEPHPSAEPPLRRRRAQAAALHQGMWNGRCHADSDSSDNLPPNSRFGTDGMEKTSLVIEADEASDLNLLITHVAKILLEDMMDCNVTLVPRANNVHGIQRIADQIVHANFDVGLEEPRDFSLYTELVEMSEQVKDLGATGYSRSGGLFIANAHKLGDVSGQCLYPDYWETYTEPAILERLLSVHDVPAGRADDGTAVCDATANRGFCPPETQKYYSQTACDAQGFSLRDPTKPCRAILGHFPSYEPAVNEQLINNLGESGFEFGMVWLGRNATEIIRQRASAGEVFLFHHWYPSTLLQVSHFLIHQSPACFLLIRSQSLLLCSRRITRGSTCRHTSVSSGLTWPRRRMMGPLRRPTRRRQC